MRNSPSWRVYANGFVVRLHNRRIEVLNHKDGLGGYQIAFIRCWPDGITEGKESDFDEVYIKAAKTITVVRIGMTEDGLSMLSECFMNYKHNYLQETVTYVHENKVAKTKKKKK